MSSQEKPNEIKITRFYEAPVKLVWDAWTDSAQVAQWWGPRGFTLTTHSKDLKSGGHWFYTMHGPDGVNYENKTRYLEVETHAKLIYDHGGNDERKPLFRVTALFHEVTGGTQMEMTMACPTAEDAIQTKGFIKKAGGTATWDRLAEYLSQKIKNKEVFVINRSFEAPIYSLFDMWQNPDHFSKWLAPTGFNMKFFKSDIRTGGETFYSMSAENGGLTMFGRAKYHKVEKPVCLIYSQQFTDEKGIVSRHPMAPSWPETMLTTVQFTEETPHRTRVTITWEVEGKVTAIEMETFINGRAGMTQGWTGSFDKLDEYLLSISNQ